MNPRTRKTGFTLLELMISVGILAIGLVAVITVILNSMSLERDSRQLNTAKNSAELQMQLLRGMVYGDLLVNIGANAAWTGNFTVHGLRPAQGDADGQCGWFEVRKRAGAVNDNLLDIIVRIEWAGNRGGNRVYEMAGMKSDRGSRFQSNP